MSPRWYVEVSPLDTHAVKERYCVEAVEWQEALAVARRFRHEQGPLSRFAIEVTETGYRAVDPAVRLRYVVARAPDDAPLSEAPDQPPSVPPSEPMSVGRALSEAVDDSSNPAPSTAPVGNATAPVVDTTLGNATAPVGNRAEPPPTLVGARLVYSRAEEPSESVPIAYREYAYAVAPWSSPDELRTLLTELFERAKQALGARPQGKYIQLALFDHVFDERPERPPLATLSWKDWRGQPVVTVSAKKPDAAAATRQDPAFITRPVPLKKPSEDSAEPSPASKAPLPFQETHPGESADRAPPSLESEPIPESRPPPSHQERHRHQRDDDLVAELFEQMGELHFMSDLVSGVEHVLVLLWESIPCEGTLIHVYDPDRDEFVVVRAAGPHPHRALMHRTQMSHPLFSEAFDTGGAIRVDDAASDPRFQGERWQKLGVKPHCGLCGAVQHDGRPLAAIELANPITEAPFFESESNALEYVCEQLADFVENIAVVIDDATVMPRA